MRFPQGHTGFRNYGQIVEQPGFPQRHTENYRDFSKGLMLSAIRETLPEGATPFAQDMIVTSRNHIKMAPGSSLLESLGIHKPDYMLLHGSLDFTAELVFFAYPYIGIKRTDATQWLNIGLQRGPYAWTNFAGILLFTDGGQVWSRQPNNLTEIDILDEAPVARTYASWAGRVWAGNAVIDGNLQPLGLVWSAANSDYRDWSGPGSGHEFLIDEITSGDRIVALKPMGLDFMCILLRNSIWIATRTGLRDRPGDIKSRISGGGCVSVNCAVTTQYGVIYLSDDGVRLFDGNTSKVVSHAIHPELIPLDYDRITEYRMSYDLATSRLFLHAPAPECRTWIYEPEKDRWLRFTNTALDSVLWPVQLPWLRWMDLIGSWGDQEPLRWSDYAPPSEGEARMIFLGDTTGTEDRVIEEEDAESARYFGRDLECIWELRPVADPEINTLITMKEFVVEYTGGGRIIFWAPDNRGVYEVFAMGDLPSIEHHDVAVFAATKTGRILGLQIRLCHPTLEILQVAVSGQKRSKRIEVL